MEWSSDVFSEQETCTALKFFTPDDVTEVRCSTLGRYLQEIPPPHSADAYVTYCSQIGDAVEHFQETENADAELWLYALVVRALSFEVETDIDGPMKQLFQAPK